MKRANLAKAVYDMAKLTFAALTLGPLVNGRSSVPEVVAGAVATLLLIACAWLLDKEDDA